MCVYKLMSSGGCFVNYYNFNTDEHEQYFTFFATTIIGYKNISDFFGVQILDASDIVSVCS